jgi:hypothetical protein
MYHGTDEEAIFRLRTITEGAKRQGWGGNRVWQINAGCGQGGCLLLLDAKKQSFMQALTETLRQLDRRFAAGTDLSAR